MKITIPCTCNAPYEIEVEPNTLPPSVTCPSCGGDGTEYAHWVIQNQPAGQEAPAENPVPAEEAKPCRKHKDQSCVESCFWCRKAICLKCMEDFGYFCSIACRNRAEEKGMMIPVYDKQKSV